MSGDPEQDIFDSALTDETPVETQVEEVQQEEPETLVVARDDQGRFAPKPEVEAEKPRAEEPERGPPAWRLKEEADARRAAETRASQLEAQLQQYLQQQQQKQNPPPDIFEDAPKFVDSRVGSAVDPVKQEIGQLREFYSQREAIREHGQEKVKAAYDWIAQGMQSRDPERMAIYNRAMGSMDPFGEIVTSHAKQALFEQIGSDPNAYVEKQLDERLKDPAFAAKMLERIRGATQARPSSSVTQLPPSLNRMSSAQPRGDDDDDDSEAGLFRQATR